MDTKLNQFLQPENSPIAQNQGAVDSYQFFAEHERSSVDQSRIRNFNFSQGFGGTITLGGTANGAGELRILDANGNLIVLGDTSGLTIYDGNLLVKNNQNTTIIDTGGIVSTASFSADQIEGSGGTTTSTTYVSIPGSSMNPFVLSRSARVVFFVEANSYNTSFATGGWTNNIRLVDSLDGGLISFPVGGLWSLNSINGTANSYVTIEQQQFVSVTYQQIMSQGTHTLSLQQATSGAGTARTNFFLLGYIILGS